MSSTYQPTAFLNLPVTDLNKSISFYASLGFVQNHSFSDGNAAQMSLPPTIGATGPKAHEGGFKIMLLGHSFFRGFLPSGMEIADATKVAQCLLCIGCDGKEAVDEMVQKAAQNGGRKDIRAKTDIEKETEEKMGFYGGVVADPDGHIVEFVYMPPEAHVGKE